MRQTREFKCADEAGNIYTIVELQNTKKHRPLSGPAQTVLGKRHLFTNTGQHVTEVSEGIFKIIETDTLIARL